MSSSPFTNVIVNVMMKVGANLGTTTTGIIAALAASGHQLALALQLALCHCIFNIRFSIFSMYRFSAPLFFLFWVPHSSRIYFITPLSTQNHHSNFKFSQICQNLWEFGSNSTYFSIDEKMLWCLIQIPVSAEGCLWLICENLKFEPNSTDFEWRFRVESCVMAVTIYRSHHYFFKMAPNTQLLLLEL